MGPTFRAEKSKTSRHLSEIWMAEMEATWMDLYDIIEIGKDEIRCYLEPAVKTAKFDIYTTIKFN
jgi:asparaginyl-tRNA synthetase